ncbi:hypothetical protein ABZW49_37095, partial [Nonomuraea wenchangensis]
VRRGHAAAGADRGPRVRGLRAEGDADARRAYTLTGGQALSPRDQAGVVGQILGRPIKLIERSRAETRAEFDRLGWSGPRLEALLELKRQSAAWDWKIFDTVERLTGRPPLTLRDWVRENVHHFR